MNADEEKPKTERNSRNMASVGSPQTETTLRIQEARDGGVAAFEDLYRSHVGRVYALCLRMTGNPTLAEELTQEAFVQAWEKLKSFRSESRFGTWLHRIAVNRVLDAQRRAKRRTAREVAESDAPVSADKNPDEHQAGTAQPSNAALRMDLEAAIAALPEGARTVFVLHDVEGYRHDEIASLAGIAEGTSRAHLHRARKLLREMLKP